MSEAHEQAESIQHHGHRARGIAVLIAILAAMLAMTEMAEKNAQNEYMTRHIAVTNEWAFYQAKNLRATTNNVGATILARLPTASDPAVQADIKRLKDTEARLRDEPDGDGMKQLMERAKDEEHTRDEAFHRYHQYEYVVGALQIAIVLASVAVVTNVPFLAIIAIGIGVGAGSVGTYVALH